MVRLLSGSDSPILGRHAQMVWSVRDRYAYIGNNFIGIVGNRTRSSFVSVSLNVAISVVAWAYSPVKSLCAFVLVVLSGSALAQQAPSVVQPGAPGQPSKTLPADMHGTLPTPSPEDSAFMQGMIMHHSQAVEMTALIPSHTKNDAIRRLGSRISASQTDEMNFMKRWLVTRGKPISMAMPGMPDMDMSGAPMKPMPGMLTPAQMAALRNAQGAAFDHLFLTGMIQHHNGALTMVKELFAAPGSGQDADLFNFATDADNTQRAEIRIMEDLLKETK